MPDEVNEPIEESIKAIKDKLSEVSDVQLVNKLDLINMKNELDKLKITSGPSSETVEKIEELTDIAKKTDVLKNFEKLKKEVGKLKSDLQERKPEGKGPSKSEIEFINKELEDIKSFLFGGEKEFKDAKKIKDEIAAIRSSIKSYKKGGGAQDELKLRIENLEKRVSGLPSAGKKGVSAGEIGKLRERIESLESAKPARTVKAGSKCSEKELKDLRKKIPDVIEKINEIERLRSDIDSLNSLVRERKAAVSGRGKGKGKPLAPSVPEDLIKRLDAMEETVSGLGLLRSEIERDKGKISILEKKLAGGKTERPEDVESFRKKISDIENRLSKISEKLTLKGEKEAKAVSKDLAVRLEDQEREMLAIRAGAQAKLIVLSKDIEDLKSRMKGFKDKASGEKIPPESLKKIDSIGAEINAMKAKLMGMDKKMEILSFAATTETKKGLKKAEKALDVNRLEKLEKNLEKLSMLAANLRPIELPKMLDDESAPFKELKARVNTLHKLVGEGVSDERFRAVEEDIEELKLKLPERLIKEVKQKVGKIEDKMNIKISKLDELKKDIVRDAVEHLLAQPGTIGKFVNKELNDRVEAMHERMGNLEHKLKLSDLTKYSDRNKRKLELLETDIRTLEARISSGATAARPSKPVTHAKGVARDVEILKTKMDWLESTMHKLDLKHIYERIDEMESKVRSMRERYPPLVIE